MPHLRVMAGVKNLLKSYSGFGALKCVLLPVETEEDKKHWAKSELELFPLVHELHRAIRSSSVSEEQYKQYINSIILIIFC